MRLNTQKLFVILLFLCIILLALQPVNDPDFWWHLRTGQLIVESGQIPHADPFSYTMQGQPWIAHEWLSDVLIYTVYRFGGLPLLMMLFALIITAAFATVFIRCAREASPYITGFCVLLGAVASNPLWGVRPQMITLLFFGTYLYLLERYQKSHQVRFLIPLPIMMLAWVNFHGAFILGLALVGVFLAGEVIEWLWRHFHEKLVPPGDTTPMVSLAVSLGVSLMASLLNPNGVKILLYPFQTLTDPSMQEFIQEWQTPDFSKIMWVPLALLFLALIGTGLAARRRYSITRILIILVFSYAALSSMRHIPLFVVAVVPTLADQISALLPFTIKETPQNRFLGWVNWSLVLIFLIAVGLRFTQQSGKQAEKTAGNFPQGAVEWIEANHPSGRMLNSYNWGGYLIWSLYPQYLVYIDGRADVYGPTFFAQYADLYLVHKGWQAELEKQGIDFVLVEHDSLLADALSQTSDWIRVYKDDISVIYHRGQ